MASQVDNRKSLKKKKVEQKIVESGGVAFKNAEKKKTKQTLKGKKN